MSNRFLLTVASMILTTISSSMLSLEAVAQTDLRTRNVITGLDTPWEILWGPDGRIWMTERAGKVSRVDPVTGTRDVLVTIADVHEQSESGLLGLALHPSFADTPWVYVVYNYSTGNGIAEKLVRYRYNGSALIEPTILLQSIPGFATHDGSRLLITPDRKLLMTTGDAQDQPAAQRHTSIVGKILRMNLDGSPAADNPWPRAAYPANYIWTTGHRNAQGLTVGTGGMIYSSEHGPNNDDEINIIRSSRNYGWPNVHGTCDLTTESQFCVDSNVAEPIMTWTPTTAVAGVEYYNSGAIPEWRNSLLLTNLKESDLRVLKLSADGLSITSETILYDNVYGRLRDVAVAPDGRVFIATSNRDGRARPGFPLPEDDRIIEIRAVASASEISAPTITPDTIEGGQQYRIEFTATGAFTANNMFTAQLSDASGSFASPITIGTLSSLNGGIITTTLACDIVPGTGYRVRIVSSDPAVTSPESRPLTINAPARPNIVVTGAPTVCAGSSVQLGVTGGTRARWSPAIALSCTDCDNPVATPAATTMYTVTVTNPLGCETSDTVTIIVRPLPNPTITQAGQSLTAPDGYATYQWYRNDTALANETGRTLVAQRNGRYTVRVVDFDGCAGSSEAVQVVNVGVEMSEARIRALHVSPHPALDHVSIVLSHARTADVRIELVDIRGVTVRNVIVVPNGGTARASVDLLDVVPGAYVVRVTSGREQWVRTIVKY